MALHSSPLCQMKWQLCEPRQASKLDSKEQVRVRQTMEQLVQNQFQLLALSPAAASQLASSTVPVLVDLSMLFGMRHVTIVHGKGS
eukprot:3908473-Amphidinium_carterae.1